MPPLSQMQLRFRDHNDVKVCFAGFGANWSTDGFDDSGQTREHKFALLPVHARDKGADFGIPAPEGVFVMQDGVLEEGRP